MPISRIESGIVNVKNVLVQKNIEEVDSFERFVNTVTESVLIGAKISLPRIEGMLP